MKIEYGINENDGYYVKFSLGDKIEIFTGKSNNTRQLSDEVNPLPNTKEVNWYKVFNGESFNVNCIGEGVKKRGKQVISFDGFKGRVDSNECAVERIKYIRE